MKPNKKIVTYLTAGALSLSSILNFYFYRKNAKLEKLLSEQNKILLLKDQTIKIQNKAINYNNETIKNYKLTIQKNYSILSDYLKLIEKQDSILKKQNSFINQQKAELKMLNEENFLYQEYIKNLNTKLSLYKGKNDMYKIYNSFLKGTIKKLKKVVNRNHKSLYIPPNFQ